uniref:Secreted protein n=1 Tax=Ascaris lumbricoides TaxID=6252 RepID=A0A0M3HZ75_ASCLU
MTWRCTHISGIALFIAARIVAPIIANTAAATAATTTLYRRSPPPLHGGDDCCRSPPPSHTSPRTRASVLAYTPNMSVYCCLLALKVQ